MSKWCISKEEPFLCFPSDTEPSNIQSNGVEPKKAQLIFFKQCFEPCIEINPFNEFFFPIIIIITH